MITEISTLATVKLDGSGNGQTLLGPPSGTRWQLRLATTNIPNPVKQPQVWLYRGSASGPNELIDTTFTGASGSSGKVAGAPFFSGQYLWVVCKGGDAGATLTLQVFGQQGLASDPFDAPSLGEGFANPITAGTQLVIPAINSPNYVAGSTGWTINQDGTAEFNGGTFRATVVEGSPTGAHITLDPTPEILLYNSSNVLVGSITPTAWRVIGSTGGNLVLSPLDANNNTSLVMTASDGSKFEVDTSSGTSVLIGVPTTSPATAPGDIACALVTIGPDTHVPIMSITSPNNNATLNASQIQMFGSGPISTVSRLNMNADFIAINPTGATTTQMTITGSIANSNGAWNALTLQNGWAAKGGGTATPSYRLLASPPNSIQFAGSFTPGTKADGTVLAVLPAGFRPAHIMSLPVTCNILSGASGQDPHLVLDTAGNLSCQGCSAATIVEMGGTPMPLDL